MSIHAHDYELEGSAEHYERQRREDAAEKQAFARERFGTPDPLGAIGEPTTGLITVRVAMRPSHGVGERYDPRRALRELEKRIRAAVEREFAASRGARMLPVDTEYELSDSWTDEPMEAQREREPIVPTEEETRKRWAHRGGERPEWVEVAK